MHSNAIAWLNWPNDNNICWTVSVGRYQLYGICWTASLRPGPLRQDERANVIQFYPFNCNNLNKIVDLIVDLAKRLSSSTIRFVVSLTVRIIRSLSIKDAHSEKGAQKFGSLIQIRMLSLDLAMAPWTENPIFWIKRNESCRFSLNRMAWEVVAFPAQAIRWILNQHFWFKKAFECVGPQGLKTLLETLKKGQHTWKVKVFGAFKGLERISNILHSPE